jgi:hypothetical protein
VRYKQHSGVGSVKTSKTDGRYLMAKMCWTPGTRGLFPSAHTRISLPQALHSTVLTDLINDNYELTSADVGKNARISDGAMF